MDRPERAAKDGIAGTGPGSRWRMGLVALVALALVIVLLQLLGGPASTDVVPGTPVSAPPAPQTPAGPA